MNALSVQTWHLAKKQKLTRRKKPVRPESDIWARKIRLEEPCGETKIAQPKKLPMTAKRRRFKQTLSLDERLRKTAEEYRAEAKLLQEEEKREFLQEAREFEAQISINRLFDQSAFERSEY